MDYKGLKTHSIIEQRSGNSCEETEGEKWKKGHNTMQPETEVIMEHQQRNIAKTNRSDRAASLAWASSLPA